ncbi:MAG: hypothetical protein KF724_05920 [Phycisphaeraceae bacterium]|nr:hypothetical protein [Phycisphaeraceae bacterium]
MHILTKIFIVIVSLFTVALVPLVMVNAANERTFKSRWESEQARANEAIRDRDATRARSESELQARSIELEGLKVALRESEARNSEFRSQITTRDSELIGLRARQDDFNAIMKTYAENDKAKTEIVNMLNREIIAVRSRLTQVEQEFVKLDEDLTATRAKLDVADASRRALQEEVQRLMEERDQAMSTISKFVAWVGPLPTGGNVSSMTDALRIPADRSLSATIIQVRRGPDSVLAEINAGSRDGVQPGWVMTIADGGKFIGNLRLTTVDLTRSTGVVELEDSQARGEVRTGQKAVARKGE